MLILHNAVKPLVYMRYITTGKARQNAFQNAGSALTPQKTIEHHPWVPCDRWFSHLKDSHDIAHKVHK